MKEIFCFFIGSISLLRANAQEKIFTVVSIADSMKKNANVVLRDEYIKYTLKDINTAKYEVHDVYTILNESGKDYLNFNEFSSKFRVLDDAEIKVYDAFGMRQNTYSKKEMTSLNYGEGLVPEGKLTYFNVNAPVYPFTLEINYTIKYKGIFGLPGFIFQPAMQSVEHAVFEVEAPSEPGIRYKLVNTYNQPVITHDGIKDIYHWEVKNLTAYKSEKNSGSRYSYEPAILLGPNKFQLDDYEGDMTTWKNFGAWINNLYAKTSGLPDEKKAFYQTLVKNAATAEEKARILYNYMQNNMRYVSIQLGIGGLRPFPASFVDEKKYGDCKALSNYLKSALDAVGIKSNIVIIQGGMTPRNVLEDFPSNYFNHVILCIPQPTDSIWLECTSTTLPFAELGPFTENRKAMMVTDNGGVLINTPGSKSTSNTEFFRTNIAIEENGGATVTTIYNSKGEGRDNLLMYFHDLKDDDKRKYFVTDLDWKHPDIIDITTSSKTDIPYTVIAKMEYEKIYSFKTGSKLFLEPRLHPVFDEDIPETEKRVRDYYFTCPYEITDTTFYKFPPGYALENLPKNKSFIQPFAQYTSTYSWDAASLTFSSVALLKIKERIIKAADYQKLLDFKKQVMSDSQEKIVIKKE
jgi:transglutaminase-like putative cysteine protease